MKSLVLSISPKFLFVSISMLFCTMVANRASAQCADTIAPVYSNSCSDEYFESINITGTSVTSTVYITGIASCMGTYINDYALQGSTAPIGSTVAVNIARHDEYASFLSVYIDWNNDGVYETSELCGTIVSLSATTIFDTVSFTVPAGAVTGTKLHMRVMNDEDSGGAPCTGTYGQAYDFFFIVDTGCTMPVLTVHPNGQDTVSNCPGGAGVNITASGVGMSGTITWAPSAGLSATTGPSVNADPATTTVYTITGTTTGTCTATYLDTVTEVSTGYPTDSIIYGGPYVFCFGDSALLVGTTGPGYTYRWYNNGMGTYHSRGDTYLATHSGVYTLVIDEYGCIDTSNSVTLTFNPLPVPTITFNGTTFYTGNYYTSYQWYRDGTAITGATTDSLRPTSNGIYDVEVTDTNGCMGMDTTSFNLDNLGVANINNAASILIYPNPTSSVINISSPVIVKAVIKGIEGEIIMEQNDAKLMDMSSLPAGMYFIEVYDEKGNKLAVQKVVKE